MGVGGRETGPPNCGLLICNNEGLYGTLVKSRTVRYAISNDLNTNIGSLINHRRAIRNINFAPRNRASKRKRAHIEQPGDITLRTACGAC